MVKILIRNDKLYLKRAGKETELESVTIYSHKVTDNYEIVVFPHVVGTIKRGQTFVQKTYPLLSIELKKVTDDYIQGGKYYNKSSKYYYINYYVR